MSQRRNQKINMYLKTNENRNTIYQNLWDVEKAVLKGKYKAIKYKVRDKKDLK